MNDFFLRPSVTPAKWVASRLSFLKTLSMLKSFAGLNPPGCCKNNNWHKLPSTHTIFKVHSNPWGRLTKNLLYIREDTAVIKKKAHVGKFVEHSRRHGSRVGTENILESFVDAPVVSVSKTSKASVLVNVLYSTHIASRQRQGACGSCRSWGQVEHHFRKTIDVYMNCPPAKKNVSCISAVGKRIDIK